MNLKNSKIFGMIMLIGALLISYTLWLSLRKVEIMGIHENGEFCDLLVKNFPFTEKGKIHWWLENRAKLKEKYNVPKPGKDGFFSVVFWNFGDGYKEEGKFDRRCFDDMKKKENCIDKKKLFSVWNGRNNNVLYGVDDGEYQIKENGEMIKTKYK